MLQIKTNLFVFLVNLHSASHILGNLFGSVLFLFSMLSIFHYLYFIIILHFILHVIFDFYKLK